MFLRHKKSGSRTYLQLVENRWEEGRTKQRVIATLGRLDELQRSGELDGLVRSASRFCEDIMLLDGRHDGSVVTSTRIGPALLFERLWRDSGCQAVIRELLQGRKFEFAVERAVFMTVLHRLLSPGSDRAAEKWRADYKIWGTHDLQLHHLYRAMAWLGEELPAEEQDGCTPFSPRCVKDLIEEELFLRRRDLFTRLDLVFFDTTSIYFEGEGGETLGEYGHSKDHRPDLRQMVVAAILDQEGNPICCELWPGNTTDVKTLLPVVDRLRKRFRVQQICIVADRGMFSKGAIDELEALQVKYILGARMRRSLEVRDEVLARAGRYRVVQPEREHSKDPSPLKVKEVWVEDERRYVVCLNEEQKRKDAADRQAILDALEDKLKQGDKSLVGNKGFRKYLRQSGPHFDIDPQVVTHEARYDGKWVLRSNMNELDPSELALQYKQLWMVEDVFRSAKSILETRPIFHKCDETIRGHVFCSFLALIQRKQLLDRLERNGHAFEWRDILRDIDSLTETEVERDQKRFVLRSEVKGTAGKVFQAVGVALPKTVRCLSSANADA